LNQVPSSELSTKEPTPQHPQGGSARFRISTDLRYRISGPSAFIFNISVAGGAHQHLIEESITASSGGGIRECPSGEREKRHHRLSAEAGDLQVSYSATVQLSHEHCADTDLPEIPPADLPPDAIAYLYPSRYCESDKLARMAMKEFGNLQPGFSRVTGICNWIYENVEYLRGSTNPLTSAFDTATERAGVCRDFAHLGIAFCRALAIPARFVSGYAYGLEPCDFHAYFEAFLGGNWYIFDATRLAPATGFIRVGTGRDAADTSFATIYGPVEFQWMAIKVEHLDGPEPVHTTDAITMG